MFYENNVFDFVGAPDEFIGSISQLFFLMFILDFILFIEIFTSLWLSFPVF